MRKPTDHRPIHLAQPASDIEIDYTPMASADRGYEVLSATWHSFQYGACKSLAAGRARLFKKADIAIALGTEQSQNFRTKLDYPAVAYNVHFNCRLRDEDMLDLVVYFNREFGWDGLKPIVHWALEGEREKCSVLTLKFPIAQRHAVEAALREMHNIPAPGPARDDTTLLDLAAARRKKANTLTHTH
jgi:hypothetical protein